MHITRSGLRVHALAVCFALAGTAAAGTFNISPIRAQLSGSHRTAVLTLTNADDAPVVVQVQVLAWSQKDGEERLDDTREMLLTPPVMQIPAKTAQVVRVALRREPDPQQELSYRVIFEEVPQAASQLTTGLRVALRLSVPVFVAPVRGQSSPDLAWESRWLTDGRLELAAVNRGTGHVQVTDFDVQPAGANDPVRAVTSKYVLPGSRMSWTVTPGPDANRAGSLLIRGHSDQGEFSAEIAASGPR
jgi:fimbrial chaperone protein